MNMKANYNAKITKEQSEKLKKVKHLALDMDGTIYMENDIFPFTLEVLDALRANGIGYSFLTNNPTKSVEDYLSKLHWMGIKADAGNMYSTPVATIDYIHKHYPKVQKLFMLGTPSMQKEFVDAGFEACADDPDDVPDMLVVAFDTTLTYSRLCRATWWASQGITYIATNPDFVCPTDAKTILVDCGSLQKCIEAACGRKPDKVMGKPDPSMLDGIMDRNGLKADEIAMVGDRIYTDIAMGHNAGAVSVLVLSGETTLETALEVEREARTNPHPKHWPADLIVRDIKELSDLLLEAKR